MYSCVPDIVPEMYTVSGSTRGAARLSRLWWAGYAITDYKGAGGSCHGNDGVLHKNREWPGGCRLTDITDGMSNTLMVGESSYVILDNWRVDNWPTWIGALGEDEQVRMNGRTSAPINCGCNPNTMVQAVSDDCAFSFHAEGAQFVFCDGSVHFLNQDISMQTYCNMHAMNDGQVLGEY